MISGSDLLSLINKERWALVPYLVVIRERFSLQQWWPGAAGENAE